jgi:hypothetical protein
VISSIAPERDHPLVPAVEGPEAVGAVEPPVRTGQVDGEQQGDQREQQPRDEGDPADHLDDPGDRR